MSGQVAERKIVWTDERCAGCERLPYRRSDGREYLYRYGDAEPTVCKPKCRERALRRREREK